MFPSLDLIDYKFYSLEYIMSINKNKEEYKKKSNIKNYYSGIDI